LALSSRSIRGSCSLLNDSGDDEQQPPDTWLDTVAPTAGAARRFDVAVGERDAVVEWFRARPSRAASVRWDGKGYWLGSQATATTKEDTRTGEEEALALAAEGRLLF
jgi:hypothetical protein